MFVGLNRAERATSVTTPPCCPGHAAPRRAPLGLAALPTLGVLLLPKCPLCAAAYLGAFGSLGAGAWLQASWGLPLTSACLLFALGVLGFRARRRRGYGPVLLGVVAAVVLLAGKFVLDSPPAVLAAGASLLIAASVWNTWPAPREGPEPPR
jgi:hypothetical protein